MIGIVASQYNTRCRPCAREPLLQTFNIGMFNYGKINSINIKHIYNESVDLIESYISTIEYMSVAVTYNII